MNVKKGLLVAGLAAFFTNGFAADVGTGMGEYTLNQYYTATMPVYAVQDSIKSGGWHEHHFCICNASTQADTTHEITWAFTNSAGTAVNSDATAVNDTTGLVGADTADLISLSSDTYVMAHTAADDVYLRKRHTNDTRSIGAQINGAAASIASLESKPAFVVNPATADGTRNYAYVWFGVSHTATGLMGASANGSPDFNTTANGNGTANRSVAVLDSTAGTFASVTDMGTAGDPVEFAWPRATADGVEGGPAGGWPVAATAGTVSGLRAAMGVCNSSTTFQWAADAEQCGNHPVGSLVLHVPAQHKGGTYNLYFKVSSVHDDNNDNSVASAS